MITHQSMQILWLLALSLLLLSCRLLDHRHCGTSVSAHRIDPFSVLNIPSDATPDDVRHAFRLAALRFHPDRNQEDPDLAGEKMREVNLAYMMIKKATQTLSARSSKSAEEEKDSEDNMEGYWSSSSSSESTCSGTPGEGSGCGEEGVPPIVVEQLPSSRFSDSYRQYFEQALQEFRDRRGTTMGSAHANSASSQAGPLPNLTEYFPYQQTIQERLRSSFGEGNTNERNAPHQTMNEESELLRLTSRGIVTYFVQRVVDLASPNGYQDCARFYGIVEWEPSSRKATDLSALPASMSVFVDGLFAAVEKENWTLGHEEDRLPLAVQALLIDRLAYSTCVAANLLHKFTTSMKTRTPHVPPLSAQFALGIAQELLDSSGGGRPIRPHGDTDPETILSTLQKGLHAMMPVLLREDDAHRVHEEDGEVGDAQAAPVADDDAQQDATNEAEEADEDMERDLPEPPKLVQTIRQVIVESIQNPSWKNNESVILLLQGLLHHGLEHSSSDSESLFLSLSVEFASEDATLSSLFAGVGKMGRFLRVYRSVDDDEKRIEKDENTVEKEGAVWDLYHDGMLHFQRALHIAVGTVPQRLLAAIVSSDKLERVQQSWIAQVLDDASLQRYVALTSPYRIDEPFSFVGSAQHHLNLRKIRSYKVLLMYDAVAHATSVKTRKLCPCLLPTTGGEEEEEVGSMNANHRRWSDRGEDEEDEDDSHFLSPEACLRSTAEVAFLLLDSQAAVRGSHSTVACMTRAALYLTRQLDYFRSGRWRTKKNRSSFSSSSASTDEVATMEVDAYVHALESTSLYIAQSIASTSFIATSSPLVRLTVVDALLRVVASVRGEWNLNTVYSEDFQLMLARQLGYAQHAMAAMPLSASTYRSTTDLTMALIFADEVSAWMQPFWTSEEDRAAAQGRRTMISAHREQPAQYFAYLGRVFRWAAGNYTSPLSPNAAAATAEESTHPVDGVLKRSTIASSLALSYVNFSLKDLQEDLAWGDVVPRDNQGFRSVPSLTSPHPSLSFPQGMKTFRAVDGVRLNLNTMQVTFLLRPLSDTGEDSVALLSEGDLQEALSHRGRFFFFSLDRHSVEQDHSPLQRQRLPESYERSWVHATALHADLLLKYLTLGVEVGSRVPFPSRPISVLLANLPEDMRRDLLAVHHRRENRLHSHHHDRNWSHLDGNHHANRFWIDAQPVPLDISDENDEHEVELRVGDADMKILTKKLWTQQDGTDGDAPDDAQDEQSEEAWFARNMTKHYNALGQYFPELLRLRELNKLMVLMRHLNRYTLQMEPNLEGVSSTRNSIVYPSVGNPVELENEIQSLMTFNKVSAAERHLYEATLREYAQRALARRDASMEQQADAFVRRSIPSDIPEEDIQSAVKQWLGGVEFGTLARLVALKRNRAHERLRRETTSDAAMRREQKEHALRDGDVVEIAPHWAPESRLCVDGTTTTTTTPLANGVQLTLCALLPPSSSGRSLFRVRIVQASEEHHQAAVVRFVAVDDESENRNRNDGAYSIDVQSAAKRCHLWSTDPANRNQHWSMEYASDGYYVVRSAANSAFVWTVPRNSEGAPKTWLVTEQEHRGPPQLFSFHVKLSSANRQPRRPLFAPTAVDHAHRGIVVYGGVSLSGASRSHAQPWGEREHSPRMSVSKQETCAYPQPRPSSPSESTPQQGNFASNRPSATHFHGSQFRADSSPAVPSSEKLLTLAKLSQVVYEASNSRNPNPTSFGRLTQRLQAEGMSHIAVATDANGRPLANQDGAVFHDSSSNAFIYAASGTRLKSAHGARARDLYADLKIAAQGLRTRSAEWLEGAATSPWLRDEAAAMGHRADGGAHSISSSKRLSSGVALIETAQRLAQERGATVEATGHSKGGYDAAKIGTATGVPVTTFNAPLPYNVPTTVAVRMEGDVVPEAGSQRRAPHTVVLHGDGSHSIRSVIKHLESPAVKEGNGK